MADEESAMEWLNEMLETIDVGERVNSGFLTMVPLLGRETAEPSYLTLDEALEGRLLQVTELDGGATVPELSLFNEGERDVFLLDGEELVGAKQNRVLNLSMLVPGKSRLCVPVSCVEQGRWSSRSREFSSSKSTLHGLGRANKMRSVTHAMVANRSFASDQGKVWNDVADLSFAMAADSATGAFTDVHEQNSGRLDDFEHELRPVDGQRGAVFFVGDRLVSVDLFEHPSVLRKLLHKLVRGNALEALALERDDAPPEAQQIDSRGIHRFLTRLSGASVTSLPSPGGGEAVRLEGAGVTGGALRCDGRVVHLAAFPVD